MENDRYHTSLDFHSQKKLGGHNILPEFWETKPDREIWNLFKQGNEQAFNFLYKTYVRQLFKYGCEFTSNREIVKDQVQDLFIYLRRNRAKLGDAPSIKAYLFKSLRRDIVRELSKGNRYRNQPLDENQSFDISLSYETKLIHEQLIKEKKECLERAMAKLSTKQREAIILFYYENLSYREIAEVMEMKMIKSARKLIYRAIDTLKGEILPYKSSLIDSAILLVAILSFLF